MNFMMLNRGSRWGDKVQHKIDDVEPKRAHGGSLFVGLGERWETFFSLFI